MKTRHAAVAALAMQGLCGTAALAPTPASAENITFGILGPREYELPVNYKDFFVFVQYGQVNQTAQVFDNKGDLRGMPKQTLGVGLSKFVYFTTIDALPGVGIAFEAILPEVYTSVRGAGPDRFGAGDTIWGIATWIKPTADSTLGFQTFLQAPIGDKYFTNNYYANYSSILFDAQSKYLSFTGDVGGVFRGEQNTPGAPTVQPGTTFHTNLRLGYKLNIPSFPVEPFAALDYEYNTAAKFVGGAGTLASPHNQDLALGAGLAFLYDPKQSFTIRYSRSVYGENTPPTNGVYLKYVYIP